MGVVGNCAFMAYIAKDTDIKWMCMPRFDSSFVFGSLLDEQKGGHFTILPKDEDYKSNQYYEENTNILITEITTSKGTYRVTDFAPRYFQQDRYFRPLMLVRKIEPISGMPTAVINCQPTYDYGKTNPETLWGSNHIRFTNIGQACRLTTNVPITYINNQLPFVIDGPRYLVFTYDIPLEAAIESTCEDFLNKTKRYWQSWVKSATIPQYHQSSIIRSALILKMHQFEDTGGIIASGSMSLPEFDGSGRNWDYRYCWMRDTYYTLNAFNNVGHFEELEGYFRYIQNIISQEEGRVQPLYGVCGNKDLTEFVLDLDGYKGNKPVRLGNQASEHIQNDVYGQVLVTLVPLYTDQRLTTVNRPNLDIVNYLLERIESTMDEPDAGIWEFRERAQLHCYTFLFHWAGAKAAAKIGAHVGNKTLVNKANRLIKAASARIEACYDKQHKTYTQAVGVPHADASNLQLVSLSYLPHNGDRAANLIKALEKELHAGDGLFYRYKHTDDFGKPHATFLVCAFWYVEALACVGRLKDAMKYFESLTAYANHLGIFSEDVESSTGSMWGNFPQAYSHVGLMNAASRIAKKMDQPVFM